MEEVGMGNAQECFACTPHSSRTSSVDTRDNATELDFSQCMKSVGMINVHCWFPSSDVQSIVSYIYTM